MSFVTVVSFFPTVIKVHVLLSGSYFVRSTTPTLKLGPAHSILKWAGLNMWRMLG